MEGLGIVARPIDAIVPAYFHRGRIGNYDYDCLRPVRILPLLST